jgi:hypothetical protein
MFDIALDPDIYSVFVRIARCGQVITVIISPPPILRCIGSTALSAKMDPNWADRGRSLVAATLGYGK